MPNKNPEILTPDEKRYLRSMCRYLGSLGMISGLVSLDLDTYGSFDKDDVIQLLSHSKTFDNNYRADIPEGLIQIFEKIITYISDEGLYKSPDEEGLNWEKIEIDFDCQRSSLTFSSYYSYYMTDEGTDTEFVGEEASYPIEILGDSPEFSDEKILTLYYNGSGDSGYIDDFFSESSSVPSDVEDWVYRKLESCCGGWEINEGSQGKFVFDLINKTVTHSHTYNIEESESITICEVKFGLN